MSSLRPENIWRPGHIIATANQSRDSVEDRQERKLRRSNIHLMNVSPFLWFSKFRPNIMSTNHLPMTVETWVKNVPEIYTTIGCHRCRVSHFSVDGIERLHFNPRPRNYASATGV
jgi:hypothetical protein